MRPRSQSPRQRANLPPLAETCHLASDAGLPRNALTYTCSILEVSEEPTTRRSASTIAARLLGGQTLPGILLDMLSSGKTVGCTISGHSAGLFQRRGGSTIPERSRARPTCPRLANMTLSFGNTVAFMISGPFLAILAAAHMVLTRADRLWVAHPPAARSCTPSCGKMVGR